jgi:hypothetical protein
MAIADVWFNLEKDFRVFWKGHFDKVPAAPGVYAWFYPLRITSVDPEPFLSDLSSVLAYDASSQGPLRQELRSRLGWNLLDLHLSIAPAPLPLSSDLRAQWSRLVSTPESFEQLRKVLMKSSLLMPPLYVGKTVSLAARCRQHIDGLGGNDFHHRFEAYANSVPLHTRSVSDLLFACVRTTQEEATAEAESMESLVEEILKRACQPAYSLK